MTRAEAIKILSECKEKGFKHTFYTLDEYHTAMDIAINSLRIDEQYDLVMEQADTVSLKAYEQVMWERDIAIQQLKALEQEPCGDLISRQAVTDTTICDGISCNECSFNTCEDGQPGCLLKERVDKLPPVTPQEPKTGHWNCGDDMFEYAICSSCKHETGEAWEYAKRNFKYCPNCGTRMVEPQESEDKE